MRIPESTIQKIIDEADIVKVISEYIKLEKKSSSFIGLCPFHPDQNPSLHVSPTKKIYKCFSCGEGGNVVRFVEKYEKVPFPRAVQIVGEKCGINVDLGTNDNFHISSKYYKILEDSTNFYHFLLENTVAGEEAKKYLYKRKLNDEIIKRFKIGVSQPDPDLLFKSLLKNDHQPLDMIEAGVVRGTDPYTDVFRNRIMFPLDDITGKIVGFSGRIYKDSNKDEPKYLNSAENKIFKKGNLLYNFANAEYYIRQNDSVFVFEGFMDVIAAYKCDIHNTVATMGTSISQNQINTLKKTTENIVLCYDGDQAGIDASKKAILQFLKAGFNVNSIMLPRGLDPDDFLNKFGADKLADILLNKQISGYDYLYETAKSKLDINNLNSVEAFIQEIFSYLNYFKSSIVTERFIKKLSIDTNVSVESLQNDFSKTTSINQFIPEVEVVPVYEEEVPEVRKPHNKDKYINAYKELIYIAYRSKEYCALIDKNLDNRYVDILHNSLFQSINSYYKIYNEISDEFIETLHPDEKRLLDEIIKSYDLAYKVNSDEIEIQIQITKLCDVIHNYYKELQAQDMLSQIEKIEDEEIKAKEMKKYAILSASLRKIKIIKK